MLKYPGMGIPPTPRGKCELNKNSTLKSTVFNCLHLTSCGIIQLLLLVQLWNRIEM